MADEFSGAGQAACRYDRIAIHMQKITVKNAFCFRARLFDPLDHLFGDARHNAVPHVADFFEKPEDFTADERLLRTKPIVFV